MSDQVHGTLDRQAMRADLIRDEAIRLKPYVDCCGRDWRACVARPCKDAQEGRRGKLTIGCGRNLDDVGISREEAFLLLDEGPTNDLDRTLVPLAAALPWWPALDGVRKRVLANMGFNMGVSTLLTFHETLHAIADGDYGKAADQMLASLWAKQVGPRAGRLAALMRSGGLA